MKLWLSVAVAAGLGVGAAAAGPAAAAPKRSAHRVSHSHASHSHASHSHASHSHASHSHASHGHVHKHQHKHKGGSRSSGKAPAVEHGTDLKAEPVVRAGRRPPPKKLLTRNLVVGKGAVARAGSTVVVKYVGADYVTGKDFTASTWQTGKAASFSLKGVVPGFAEGIVGMRVGGRREIVIPPKLGYGKTGAGSVIKPGETLVFVVDLKGVR